MTFAGDPRRLRPCRLTAAALAVAIGLGAPCSSRGQAMEDLQEAADALIEEYLPDDVLELVEATRGEWDSFWTETLDALHSQSIEALDEMQPYAQSALEFLDAQPQFKPYADWLRQRLDYFDMAARATQALPPPAPPPAVRTRPAPPPRRLTPPPPARKVAPPPPALSRRRHQFARNKDGWEKRAASRSAPADARTLVPTLKDIFRAEGVPEELVWMAEVESSMNPKARSPVGATGLFQLMPQTARRFGLRTSPRDERLNPEQNARAAAKYLKLLHGQFGSWPLALAAYNAGEGRVGRVLKKSSQKTFDAIADGLPVETQMYVPKVLATIKVREGADLAMGQGRCPSENQMTLCAYAHKVNRWIAWDAALGDGVRDRVAGVLVCAAVSLLPSPGSSSRRYRGLESLLWRRHWTCRRGTGSGSQPAPFVRTAIQHTRRTARRARSTAPKAASSHVPGSGMTVYSRVLDPEL